MVRAWRRAEQQVFVRRHRRDIGNLTMVATSGLIGLTRLIDVVVEERVPGAFVETGCWRGGASFLAARRFLGRGDPRQVWMFDSFEGLPEPEPVDGARALSWGESPEGRRLQNCAVDVDSVEGSAHLLELDKYTRIVKGWFDETLVSSRDEIGPISMMRIDCDWYASVRVCLDVLFDSVQEGGYVIFDDYDSWPGCTLAVHQFLSERSLPYPVKRLGNAYVRVPFSEGGKRIAEGTHAAQPASGFERSI